MVADTTRRCGECQLCCTLLPVLEISKLANKRCRYQKFGKGCTIYGKHPESCKVWSCMWLIGASNPKLRDMRRPDRTHYVVDPTPDYIDIDDGDGRVTRELVLQIWCDPKYPDSHRDPALRAFLADTNLLALVRYSSKGGSTTLFPPGRMINKQWWEQHAQFLDKMRPASEVTYVTSDQWQGSVPQDGATS